MLLLLHPSLLTDIRHYWPKPTEFIEAVRHRVAPHFDWSTTTHYGRLDPLVALIIELLQPDPYGLRTQDRIAWRYTEMTQLDGTIQTETVPTS